MKGSRKNVILDYLMSMEGFVSGIELANIAHCTPQNVSAHIKNLRRSGYDIEVSHRGYKYNREPEHRLILIKERFSDVGIHLEYIRSCINLLNVVRKEANGAQGLLYYTFNEMDVPYKTHIQGFSFAISNKYTLSAKDAILNLLSTYLGDEVTAGDLQDVQELYYDKYIIGRYRNIDKIEYFYLHINSKKILPESKTNIVAFSDVLGDYIGIKVFSVLIFEHLYASLCP